jgi:uncharacterized membrane protein
MTKGRLEAFSDGVLAIVITIMVLELHPPEEASLAAFTPLLPKFFGYLLSFVFVGIYWNNHHHLLQATKSVNGTILWANMHLLFWLSLIPFTTSWMGEHFAPIPVAFYGIVLWLSGFAYYILVRALVSHHGKESVIASAIGNDKKGFRSLYLYTTAVILSFFSPLVATAIYIAVAIMWLIPDRRIENKIKEKSA